jgi:hypothetical protein
MLTFKGPPGHLSDRVRREAGDLQEDTLGSLAVALTFAGELATPISEGCH